MNSEAACRDQILLILGAWGMPADKAERVAEALVWADLRGVASHGISMLTEYDSRRQGGRINMAAVPAILRQTPVSALVDGDGGMGHPAAHLAMSLAIEKAKANGVGVVVVRNSSHFGALGHYTELAALADLIGIATTSVSGITAAPTGGAAARFGTDPFSFAAPSADGKTFLLDMATTTVARGKVRNRGNENLHCPPGWVLTPEGLPSTDPNAPFNGGFLTSLGGSLEGASYKGYGLAAMVNILSSCLAGSTLITDPMHLKQPWGQDIAHFFMTIDPTLFRESGEFEQSVEIFSNALRATPPADPAVPVQVAGDPERARMEERRTKGIPIAPGLRSKLIAIAAEAGTPWLLY